MKVRKNKKAFTLIELLAVIVILGLLLAIAIPSVTKYITQSRKKTITTTIGNYIGALTTQVNDMEYIFTETNTVYAVPIECIALERGGTDPFGKWYQASDSYWAYVLVQYDDRTSSYTYGFTFKDSAGYGLYPTTTEKLNESGKQIQQDLDLTRPINGTITDITEKSNWTGFDLEDDTNLVVLEATSEGETGNGKTTCTLCQKGNNYTQVEEEKEDRDKTLANLIKKHNPLITSVPTLTTTSEDTNENGLYSSTDTNSGKSTYYFRGNVINNYVSFAGLTWRIIRINEDGTVRIIITSRIENGGKFTTKKNNYTDMYYSNSDRAKPLVDNWYETNIINKGYDSYVANGTFCEQAKVKYSTSWTSGAATMDAYTTYKPSFKCETDGNGKGILNGKVGLITVDEAVYAGGYFYKHNFSYYLFNREIWTMSPGGVPSNSIYVWYVGSTYPNRGGVHGVNIDNGRLLAPVINLNTNVLATGTGTETDPYVIQTN